MAMLLGNTQRRGYRSSTLGVAVILGAFGLILLGAMLVRSYLHGASPSHYRFAVAATPPQQAITAAGPPVAADDDASFSQRAIAHQEVATLETEKDTLVSQMAELDRAAAQTKSEIAELDRTAGEIRSEIGELLARRDILRHDVEIVLGEKQFLANIAPHENWVLQNQQEQSIQRGQPPTLRRSRIATVRATPGHHSNRVVDPQSVRDYLLIARDRLEKSRVTEAKDALEAAETHSLNNNSAYRAGQDPTTSRLVHRIEDARAALRDGDNSRALDLIKSATPKRSGSEAAKNVQRHRVPPSAPAQPLPART